MESSQDKEDLLQRERADGGDIVVLLRHSGQATAGKFAKGGREEERSPQVGKTPQTQSKKKVTLLRKQRAGLKVWKEY